MITNEVHTPEKRARISGFIEGKLGRPFELEPGEELAAAEEELNGPVASDYVHA